MKAWAMRQIGFLLPILTGLVLNGSAHAADLPGVAMAPFVGARDYPSTSDWRFQATFYGWLTAINGDIGVRDLPATPVNASVADVLDNLDGALMSSFLASNGRWLFLADLVLAKLSHSDDVGVYGRSRLDAGLTQAIAMAAVGYWLPLGTPGFDLAVTGGLRYVSLSSDITLTPAVLPVDLLRSQDQSWIDPTVGLVAQWAITDRWFLNATIDIGGFGVGSKLSSNGYVGVGYMWTPAISTAIGYRYLYEDYQGEETASGSFRYNATMHGPTFSLGWHF